MLKTDKLVDAVATRQWLDTVFTAVNTNRPMNIPASIQTAVYSIEATVSVIRTMAGKLEREAVNELEAAITQEVADELKALDAKLMAGECSVCGQDLPPVKDTEIPYEFCSIHCQTIAGGE